jgi:hypothetical protein
MMNRKELMRLMPANANDIAGAERIIQIGYPEIAPVMRDMVNEMRVAESPVADAFAAYFARLGQPAVYAIGQGLMRENCWLRHRIFTTVLPQWAVDVVRQLTNVLTMVATQPDAYDNDLLCVQLLIRHHLAVPGWLGHWLDFKRERWDDRNKLLLEVERELKNVQQGPGGDSSNRPDTGLGTPQR